MAPARASRACRSRATSLRGSSGIEEGPRLGGLIDELRVAVFAGEVTGRDDAVEHARRALAGTASD